MTKPKRRYTVWVSEPERALLKAARRFVRSMELEREREQEPDQNGLVEVADPEGEET